MNVTDTLTTPASCWIPGEPTTPGFHLVRIVSYGRLWVYLYECIIFPETPDRVLYCNGNSGNYSCDLIIVQLGVVTHHCLPTPENFELALAETQECLRLSREANVALLASPTVGPMNRTNYDVIAAKWDQLHNDYDALMARIPFETKKCRRVTASQDLHDQKTRLCAELLAQHGWTEEAFTQETNTRAFGCPVSPL